jgi:hypothetical protein
MARVLCRKEGKRESRKRELQNQQSNFREQPKFKWLEARVCFGGDESADVTGTVRTDAIFAERRRDERADGKGSAVAAR